MKFNITKLTKSSNDNINTIFENYPTQLEYKIKNTYFIKLLYTLIDKADIDIEYTLHETKEPLLMNNKFISSNIEEFINKTIFYTYTIEFIIKEINYKIQFYSPTSIKIDKYLYFVKLIINLCSQNSTGKHSHFTFKIILTDFEKIYPCIPIETFHINSGLTNANTHEVILFRKQEWLKVFIHECFHLFCLDFCNIELDFKKMFTPLFNINSDFLFFETLTEFWARTINISIISYFTKKNILYDEFESLMIINLQVERIYCITQMNHLLNKMGFTYTSLMDKNREKPFIENTNFFCYYVLTCVLFFHYEQTMAWFIENNETLLQFSKNKRSVLLFFQFIRNVYKNPQFLLLISQLNCPLHNCNMSAFEILI